MKAEIYTDEHVSMNEFNANERRTSWFCFPHSSTCRRSFNHAYGVATGYALLGTSERKALAGEAYWVGHVGGDDVCVCRFLFWLDGVDIGGFVVVRGCCRAVCGSWNGRGGGGEDCEGGVEGAGGWMGGAGEGAEHHCLVLWWKRGERERARVGFYSSLGSYENCIRCGS